MKKKSKRISEKMKYVVNEQTKEVLCVTKHEDYEVKEGFIIVDDPPTEKGVDRSKPLIYKDGKIKNLTNEDKEECDRICAKLKITKAKEQAGGYMAVVGDTYLSSRALVGAICNQLKKIEAGQPMDSFEDMMSDYNQQIDDWADFSENVRLC